MTLSTKEIETIAESIGTPFYVYDAEALRSRVRRLKSAFPKVEFVYSLKANPNISVVRTLIAEGIGTEVCSLFEIEASVIAGSPTDKTIFVGPAKSPEEITRAIELGVKAIIAESLEELYIVQSAAHRRGTIQSVALRINPDFHVMGAKLSMSGRPTQFGIDQDQMHDAIDSIKTLPNLRLAGIHVYMGTRILTHKAIASNAQQILELADQAINHAGHELDFVDVGGGFGVPYHGDEEPLDLDSLADEMNPIVTTWQQQHRYCQIVIELGRYMVAEAGSMVTKVRYIKRSKGQMFAICDGGSNCHTAAGQSASFRKNFPLRNLRNEAASTSKWTISGPLCTPADIIAKEIDLPDIRPGDLIRIDKSGAYGPSASPVHFLSFGFPAEVMVDHDKATVIRRRDCLEDFIAAQTPYPLITRNAFAQVAPEEADA